MKKGGIIVLGGTDCPLEYDEAYNRWFNEVHVPMAMKFKGLKAVFRGKFFGDAGENPKYVVGYQFDSLKDYETYQDSPERKAALAEMAETQKYLPMQPKWRLPYEILKTWEK